MSQRKQRRPGPTTSPQGFVALAGHLRSYADLLVGLVDQEPSPTSLAAVDAEDRGWAGLGASRPCLESTLFPKMLLGSTIDHLRGAAACVDAKEVLYSFMSLLRPMVEATAAANFLLDPALDRRERVRRWANYRLESAVESLRLVDPADRRHPDIGMRYGNQIYWLITYAEKYGFEVETERARGGLEPMRHLLPKLPSGMALSRELLNDLEGVDAGALLHRTTSAIIHAKMHGLLLLISAEDKQATTDPAIVSVPSVLSLKQMATWTAPAIWGIDRCARRACAYYGWPEAAWHRRAAPVLQQWREWVTASA